MALYFIEAMLVLAVALFVVFQVLAPFAAGRPIFPMFRKEVLAQKILAEVEEEARAKEILEEAEEVQRGISNKTNPTEESIDESHEDPERRPD